VSNFRRVTIRGRWATGGRAVIVLVAAGVVAAGLAMVLGATSAPSPDELAIQSTIQGALQARMTLEVPPARPASGAAAAAMASQMHARVDAQIGQYYAAGPTHDRMASALHQSIAGDNAGQSRYVAGGVDWVHFDSITINSADAQVNVHAQLWNRQSFTSSTGTTTETNPRSVVVGRYALHRDASGWRITNELLSIESGDRP